MEILIEYAPALREGALVTFRITVLGIIGAIVVAFAVGLARLSRLWVLRAPAYVLIEVFRGTSMIVQLFWFFYALPFVGIELLPMVAGVLVLSLNEGAYAAEVVRGTISSRPRGQFEAAIALGMSPTQRLWRVLIPQSIPGMLPAFGNVFVDLLKASSLVSLVTVADLTFTAYQLRKTTGETLALFGGILVAYFVMAMMLALVTRLLEGRFAVDRPLPRRRRVLDRVEAAS
jgi:polar amino acid transport system permease protein